MIDRLYGAAKEIFDDFNFDSRTARIFDDMLKRSVPHYEEIQEMICSITRNFAQRHTVIYDLGCSTGTTLMNISRELSRFPVSFIGIDNSEAMLGKARARLGRERQSRNACC